MRVWDWVISKWFKDRRAAVWFSRSWRAGVVLVLLCLTVYLPGLFTIPPIDRDESRFAQASRQMFEAAALPEAKKDPAMHSGGWVVPMLQDKPRLNKPPLVYWLQVASAWVFTAGDPLKDEIWMYRIPGVLCAMATVLMTWRMGRSMFDPRAALLGAALLAVCPLVVFDAHQARADQLLLTTVVATQSALWRVWRGAKQFGTSPTRKRGSGASSAADGVAMQGDASKTLAGASGSYSTVSDRWLAPLSFWICLGVSILAKGPIGPMIAVLTCLALCLASRRWRWLLALRPAVGVVIVAAIVAPWLYAVGEHVGWSKYLAIIKDETIGRSLEPKEGHWGPPGYHTVLLAVLFWPGSLTTAMAVGRAFRRGFPANPERERRATTDAGTASGNGLTGAPGVVGRVWSSVTTAARRLRSGFAGRDAELFCLAWIVPAWIVFELIGTKLPHYTMPMYPAVGLLSARCVFAVMGARSLSLLGRLAKEGFALWCFIGVLIPVVPVAIAMITPGTNDYQQDRPGIAIVVGALLGVCATAVVWTAKLDAVRFLQTQIAGILAAIVCVIAILGVSIPYEPKLWTVRRVVDRLNRADPNRERPICAIDFWEDSLVFGTRARIRRLDTRQIDEWLATNPNGLVVASVKGGPAPAVLRPTEKKNRHGSAFNGFDYASGKELMLDVFERNR